MEDARAVLVLQGQLFLFSSLQPPCTSVGNVTSWKLGDDDPLVL
jgi:hypothetical protein